MSGVPRQVLIDDRTDHIIINVQFYGTFYASITVMYYSGLLIDYILPRLKFSINFYQNYLLQLFLRNLPHKPHVNYLISTVLT